MQTDAEQRYEKRTARINDFLGPYGLSINSLNASTVENLHEWARLRILSQSEPSANLSTPLLKVCKAVESELASRLKQLPVVANLNYLALGELARALKSVSFTVEEERQIRQSGIKPGFISRTLPDLLKSLAQLRKDTHAAHGDEWIGTASEEELRRAEMLAGKILKDLVNSPSDKA